MEQSNQALPRYGSLMPGVGSSYGHAWRQMWKYFLELLLILIVFILIDSFTGLGYIGGPFWSTVTFIYGILIVGPIGYGVAYAYLRAVRGETLKTQDMFYVFQNYWNAVLANILVAVIIGIGLVLLVVPGIVFACKLAFTPYLITERKMEVVEAIKQSWRMTSGHAWKVFLIGVLAIFISIAGLICFGVGILVAWIWIGLALASLYIAVEGL